MAIVSRLRLSDTAVTPCDASIENADHARVGRVAADERDVRAVQGRHRAWRAVAGVGAENLMRQIRRRRVRHGVVRVQQVEVMARATTRTSVFVSASRYCGSRNSG